MSGINDKPIKLEDIEPLQMPPVEPSTEVPKESDLSQSALHQAPAKSIDDVASMTFGLYFPKFCMGVDKLHVKSLRRILKALVGVPLEDLSINLKRTEEKQMFGMGQHLMEAKMALIFSQLIKAQESVTPKDETVSVDANQENNNNLNQGDPNNG